MSRDPGHAHAAPFQMKEEQHVVSHQPPQSEHFDREEITIRQHIHVSGEKINLRHPTRSTWSRPVALSFRKMDILKMLAELRQEREQLEEAIITLERLARGRGRRRGRPPAWMRAAKEAGPKRRGHPPGNKNRAKTEAAA